MVIEFELLHQNRELLARIGSTNDVAEVTDALATLSPEQERLVMELANVEDTAWTDLLGAVRKKDVELSAIIRSARQAVQLAKMETETNGPFGFSDRIVGFSASPYLGLQNGMPIIRVTFSFANKESMVSDQDLEDSLWVGASVLDSVAKSVQLLMEKFEIPRERIAWGDDFEARLALAEASVPTIRRLFGGRSQ